MRIAATDGTCRADGEMPRERASNPAGPWSPRRWFLNWGLQSRWGRQTPQARPSFRIDSGSSHGCTSGDGYFHDMPRRMNFPARSFRM
jgi:hypothetical protein